jgi:hypothetical protein
MFFFRFEEDAVCTWRDKREGFEACYWCPTCGTLCSIRGLQQGGADVGQSEKGRGLYKKISKIGLHISINVIQVLVIIGAEKTC